MDIKQLAILTFKLIVKAIGFICLGIGFLSLYIPIITIHPVLLHIGEITKEMIEGIPYIFNLEEEKLRKYERSLSPLEKLQEYKEKRKKEEEQRRWLVEPLKEFFMRKFDELKNW